MAMIGRCMCWIDRELILTPWNPYMGHLAERVKFYSILSISAAGVYWMTWCHIQIGMINMISHGYAMNSPVSKKFLHVALKYYFISKTIRCFWLARYVIGMPRTGTDCMQVLLYACARCCYWHSCLRRCHFCLFCSPVVKVNGQFFFFYLFIYLFIKGYGIV
jgi:hypothetical protein